MSYMRWPVYVWTGGACEDDCPDDCALVEHEIIHLWARAEAEDEQVYVIDPEDYDGFACGFSMPQSLFDELVVVRYAQLVKDGLIADTIRRALDPSSSTHGNFGSWDLRELAGDDPAAEFHQLMQEATADRIAPEPTVSIARDGEG